MNLSRDWNALKFHQLALADLHLDVNNALHMQRFDLINKAVQTVSNLFYDLMSNAFMTPVTLVPNTLGRYSSSGSGTWTAATAQLIFAGMNTSFASGDIGNVIGFSIGPSTYMGIISSVINATTITVFGQTLPVSDGTVNIVLVFSTNPTGNALTLAGLRIMRTGQQIKLELESTATKTLEAVTSQAVFNFDGTAPTNINKIVWSYSGEQIIFAYGTSLPSAGTFTLRYPRVPNLVALDTDAIDLPDGAAIEIAHLYYKNTLMMREKNVGTDLSNQYAGLMTAMYRTFGQEVNSEVIKEKLLALK